MSCSLFHQPTCHYFLVSWSFPCIFCPGFKTDFSGRDSEEFVHSILPRARNFCLEFKDWLFFPLLLGEKLPCQLFCYKSNCKQHTNEWYDCVPVRFYFKIGVWPANHGLPVSVSDDEFRAYWVEDVYPVGMWNRHRKYKMFSFIISMLKSSVDDRSQELLAILFWFTWKLWCSHLLYHTPLGI